MPNPAGLYVHIPFCSRKCKFCHFAVYPGLLDEVPAYLDALEREMEMVGGRNLRTLFIGGGTPTVLTASRLRGLFSSIRRHFYLEPGCEITVECNPESSDAPRLEALLESGVRRLSFGLQAGQDRHLQASGRNHDFAGFVQSFHLARKMGFSNLNVDLIYGLPDQTLEEWDESIESVLALAPEHISAYALEIEDQTAYAAQEIETDDALQSEMYRRVSESLESSGYGHASQDPS